MSDPFKFEGKRIFKEKGKKETVVKDAMEFIKIKRI